MTDQTTRVEIEKHIQALNVAWKDYDDIETGRSFVAASDARRNLEKDRINRRFKREERWLREHGVPESALDYDKDTKTFSLRADWIPPADE